MQDELVDGDIDLQRLRELLVVARARGFRDPSAWADITIQWTEETNAKIREAATEVRSSAYRWQYPSERRRSPLLPQTC
jgi:hypothetical protein